MRPWVPGHEGKEEFANVGLHLNGAVLWRQNHMVAAKHKNSQKNPKDFEAEANFLANHWLEAQTWPLPNPVPKLTERMQKGQSCPKTTTSPKKAKTHLSKSPQ